MAATGLDYAWYFEIPYTKYDFSDIKDAVDKIVQTLDGYIKISAIRFFKGGLGGPEIKLNCDKTDYRWCMEKIANYFEKTSTKT